ncbi:MAG TPA: phosphatase PAP2 family protein [Acidimicrobiales bacterium]|nr:phosphatase PAP2 family protein [Acidimicrobiales bacterium]
MGFDRWVVRTLAHHRVGWLTHVARGAMHIGTSLKVLGAVALVGAVYVVVRRRWRLGASVVLAVVSSAVVVSVLKAIIDRPRPPHVDALIWVTGPSMPSTHAARIASAAAGFLLAVEWRNHHARIAVTAAVVLGVVAVGFFLVYLGTHWPTDVLAGWAIGAAAGTASARITRRLQPTDSD